MKSMMADLEDDADDMVNAVAKAQLRVSFLFL